MAVAVLVAAGASSAIGQQLTLREAVRVSMPPPPEEGDLQSVTHAALGPGCTLILGDPRGQRLIKMDRADNSFVVLEPQGIGYPGFLARVADTLLVLTVAPPRVLFLDSENIVRRQVSLESTIFNPKGFAVRADGSFLVAGGIAAGPVNTTSSSPMANSARAS